MPEPITSKWFKKHYNYRGYYSDGTPMNLSNHTKEYVCKVCRALVNNHEKDLRGHVAYHEEQNV